MQTKLSHIQKRPATQLKYLPYAAVTPNVGEGLGSFQCDTSTLHNNCHSVYMFDYRHKRG